MKYWAELHNDKDADDLQTDANGLMKLATASNTSRSSRDGPGKMQRPLKIRDASNSIADEDDMEVEEQDDNA
jgi:hypothetical protein